MAAWSRNLRQRLLPPGMEEAKSPLWSLLYLAFLFMDWPGFGVGRWLVPTLLSVPVFLLLYFSAFWQKGWKLFAHLAGIAALGFALAPINSSANTYVIYAAVLLPLTGIGLRKALIVIVTVLLLYGLEMQLIGIPLRYTALIVLLTGVISVAICAANHFHREKELRQAELKLSHDEVRRLAALAERERIGRDLHDLLGHTLSLITLKSELAARLFDRDPAAARREILDVERVARDALGQVRRAVSGIRSAGLAAELASARLLLESGHVRLDYELPLFPLPAELETVLALCVREAVTNIQRHARATQARVSVVAAEGEVRLSVDDNGRGGVIEPGNGLSGMRERLHALGGRLEIRSGRGSGTQVLAALPLRSADAQPAARRDDGAAVAIGRG